MYFSAQATSLQRQPWQEALAHAYTSVAALARDGLLPSDLPASELERLSRHQLRIPKALAARFDRTNLSACPLYRQAVPWAGEVDPVALPPFATAQSLALYGRPLPWDVDAIGDVARLAAKRLTHRYQHRALLHLTHACALYCRYCFRKTQLDARNEDLYGGPTEEALAYVRQHEDIEEVILSGGDPMVLPNAAWRRLLAQLDAIAHVKVVRIHTRMPAVLPERFEAELADIFAATRVQVHVACHVNHPDEWTEEAFDALQRFRDAGVTLLHQGVLLRGINDDDDVLFRLLRTTYAHGVIPFSLHHPDLSPHTFGYRLPIARGRQLMGNLAGKLAGPALPRYVLDLPQGHGKVGLMEYRVSATTETVWQDGIGAQLWQMPLPHTRAHAESESLRTTPYLDVWRQSPIG